jgi:phytoene dehydrogenase-like protein
VISNVTRYDMGNLIRGEVGERFETEQLPEGWGAFMLYCAVEGSFDDRGTLYHQIHCEPLPHCGARSIFVSLSHVDDRSRAPHGWRTVTVSAHVAEPWRWEELPEPEYEARKREVAGAILASMEEALPGFDRADRKFLLTGTPRTFRHYTGRLHGMVGGIPHSIRRNMVFAADYRTSLDDLYLVGDTVYPGQGTPAVVLGALNLVDALA